MEAIEIEDFGQVIHCWIFFITGILSIAFALFFFIIIKYSFFKGLGLVFLTAGIVEMVAGIFTRFPYKQLHLKAETITGKGMVYLSEQISRMEICLYSCIVSMAVGILLYLAFFRSAQTFWKGIGLGLLIQGLLLSGLFQMKHNSFKSYKAWVTQPTTEAY